MFEGLFGGSAEEVWRTGAPRHPRFAGLLNLTGNTSFVSSVAQVMMRIPSVAVFLASHVTLCRREPRESCVVCLLEKVRLELKMTGQELAKCKDHMPSSLLRNALDQDFAAESEHDAALFLQSLLHAAACERTRARLQAGRLAHAGEQDGAREKRPTERHGGDRWLAERATDLPVPGEERSRRNIERASPISVVVGSGMMQ